VYLHLNDLIMYHMITHCVINVKRDYGGEGHSGMATGYPATVPGKEAALPRQGTANARGDEQESS
jgi:hypothetical protein